MARGEAVPAVVRLPAGKAPTVRAAADVLLDSPGNAHTLRSYGIGVTPADRGQGRPWRPGTPSPTRISPRPP
ncbi:hypothetical protein ACFXAE_33750 [Streptomyces sp. NPDC059454]|uniref:hypothetical protein n=1 Tax=Streptomyces sp. NPDC059454 TaxID=3346836 RepID=UPI0036B8DE12